MSNAPTQHQKLLEWIEECRQLCGAERLVWIDGSEEQKRQLVAEGAELGEIIELDHQKLPGCLYHRTARNDVARTEGCTFICCRNEADAGPTNHWKAPEEAYDEARQLFRDSMRRRTMPDGSKRSGTMYVVPFSMGPVGSPFSKTGVELTDSIYVVLNMLIMCRCGTAVLETLGDDGEFTKCLHARADVDDKKRRILHFPEDNTIWSVNSGYGGNVLLGKKCLALRIASYLGKQEGWMAEHMLILGIEFPDGRIEYIAGAFPSACGKTNLAMLVPPDALARKGYKVWTVGDDIAWLRVRNGRLYAINPEAGFFGVAPGTNAQTNANCLKAVSRNTIFTNTLLCPDGTVWWEEGDGAPPEHGLDWTGEHWHPDITGPSWKPGKSDAHGHHHHVCGAHPNSRFTVPAAQCPSIAPNWEDPEGVPISAIILGARRSRLAPLVLESLDWQHGVYLGANMTSERTAAQYGKLGEVRRDPMAMRPFCGYNMADYFQHWLDIGQQLDDPPPIFRVNWFRRDDDGAFLWPGFGENLRVLIWMLERAHGNAAAQDTPIGRVPAYESIDWAGLPFPRDVFEELHAINAEDWLEEDDDNRAFLLQFGDRLPEQLLAEHEAREQRLRNGG
ncbi:phosphoenolpyruvate carboxykinase (GTP) [bacterium]|nr:phosphoenolpyruvate carboxykinase (GTP) [bacterium]